MNTNRRRASRRRRHLHVVVLATRGGGFLTEASIRDVTAKGAQLRMLRSVDLPVDLVVADAAANRCCSAKLVWRQGQTIGVELAQWTDNLSQTGDAIALLLCDLYALDGP